jgi:hypothetical protein
LNGFFLPKRQDWILEPIASNNLALFRILFGSFLTANAVILLAGGTARRQYLLPKYHFPYTFLNWLPHPTPFLVYAGFGLMILAALGITVGIQHRFSCLLYLLPQSYFFLLDKVYYENSRYLIILLVFGLLTVPVDRSFSWSPNPKSSRSNVRRFQLWGLRLIVVFMYFYSGFHKLHPDWLRGQPLGIATSGFLEGTGFHPELALSLSYLGLLVDLLALPGFLWKQTRPYAIGTLIVFHLSNLFLFNVTTMALLGLITLVLFAPPEWPEWIGDTCTPTTSESLGQFQNFTLIALILLVLISTLAPLRPLLYDGDVLWNARGSRFSWILFQRRTAGTLAYRIEDSSDRQSVRLRDRQLVDEGLLTPLQLNRIKADPQLILELGRKLSDWVQQERRFRKPRVYASALVSLNGRKPQQLIRSSSNLAEVSNAPSITFPLQQPLPGRRNLLRTVFPGD